MVGERIKELRKERGISQARLAKAIGYGQSIVTYWETGVNQPTAEAIVKLADYFGVSADYLLGRENEDGSKNYKISDSFNNNKGNINFKG